MPIQHTVQEGECLASIAFQYGLFIDTFWNYDANSGLRSKRKNPYELVPGDVVTVPDKRVQQIGCGTDARHTFTRKGVPEKLRLRLTHDNQPRAGVPYTLIIDGKPFQGTTDADGAIEHALMPNAHQCSLRIGDGTEHYDLQLHDLQPITEDAGVRARLTNLHYLRAGSGDADALNQAIASFQTDQGLPVTGTADAATCQKLQTQHGS